MQEWCLTTKEPSFWGRPEANLPLSGQHFKQGEKIRGIMEHMCIWHCPPSLCLLKSCRGKYAARLESSTNMHRLIISALVWSLLGRQAHLTQFHKHTSWYKLTRRAFLPKKWTRPCCVSVFLRRKCYAEQEQSQTLRNKDNYHLNIQLSQGAPNCPAPLRGILACTPGLEDIQKAVEEHGRTWKQTCNLSVPQALINLAAIQTVGIKICLSGSCTFQHFCRHYYVQRHCTAQG